MWGYCFGEGFDFLNGDDLVVGESSSFVDCGEGAVSDFVVYFVEVFVSDDFGFGHNK